MILRDYCVVWIIGWVACWIAFMFVFFTLEKLVLKSGLTPPWHLAVNWDSSVISYRFPDSSSILGGLIEKAPASSIASRHLVDRLTFCSWIWWVILRYLLDTSAVDDHFLDTYLNSFLVTSRHLHLSSFTEGLYIQIRDPILISSISLDLSAPVHLPNTLSHSKPLPLWFFKLF